MKAVKYSRHREAIKAFLMDNPDHPTADEIYMAIRERYPNISLATVYRNLNLLTETGELRKMSYLSGPDHFDYDTSAHPHFVCRDCGRVYDMPLERIEVLEKTAEGKGPGRIDAHELVFYGSCNACLAKAAGSGQAE